jgi:hypothetical protein
MRIVVILLLVGGSVASARVTRSVSVDAIAGAPVAVVATIIGSQNVQRAQQGNQRVETLRLTARVELAFKGSNKGARLRFLHWRARATGPVLNGLHYPELEQGRAYLLALALQGKDLQLLAPEDEPVEISEQVLRARVKQQAGLMALLEDQVRLCPKGCGRAIWLLAHAPKSLRLPDGKMAGLLLQAARSSNDGNTRLAAYSVLGELGQTSVIPEIVRACVGSTGRSDHRANAISWLQGFAKAAQVDALKQILARSSDPVVQRAARFRLSHLTR